jgi:hypothetical protein
MLAGKGQAIGEIVVLGHKKVLIRAIRVGILKLLELEI